jgi:glutamyl/glutaminyl-tRNA synthetase
VAPDGAKLSKRRHGPVVSVTTYRDAGFLPQAFVNFLCLLGWSPKDDREQMTAPGTRRRFSLEGINRANAVVNFTEEDPFDPKAVWLNAEHIRACRWTSWPRAAAVRARRRLPGGPPAQDARHHAADSGAHEAAARRAHRGRFLLRPSNCRPTKPPS